MAPPKAFALAVAAALALPGCSLGPSRHWTTPAAAAECGPLRLRVVEDGVFEGGESGLHLFYLYMDYDSGAGEGWKRLDGSLGAFHAEPGEAEFRRLIREKHARVFSAEGNTRRPGWLVRVPESVPSGDYRRIADCLAANEKKLDDELITPREPLDAGGVHFERVPRLTGVAHWGPDPLVR